MSKAFIKSMGAAIKRCRLSQELVLRQKSNDDLAEVMDHLDSIINLLYGLQEEERERALFENNFLESGYEESEALDDESEEEEQN